VDPLEEPLPLYPLVVVAVVEVAVVEEEEVEVSHRPLLGG
jgi:hypothetical protein